MKKLIPEEPNPIFELELTLAVGEAILSKLMLHTKCPQAKINTGRVSG